MASVCEYDASDETILYLTHLIPVKELSGIVLDYLIPINERKNVDRIISHGAIIFWKPSVLHLTKSTMDLAATNGYLEIVKWLHANKKEGCTTDAMDWAADNNHLEIVKWLHLNRHEGCTTYAMDYAAANNHLEMVKWLHENRKEGCTTTAAKNIVSHLFIK